MEKSIIAKYLQKIAEMVEKIEQRNIKSGYNDILIAFRGESKDYKETKLMPSLFRNPEYVKKEPLLFELLGDYNVVKNTNMREIEKAIEAQHFVEISRNLDITFNVLPSLYFACKSKEFEDGRLYIFGFPKYFSPHSNYIENVYKKVLEGENIVYDKNFRVMTHGQNNERIYAQSGGFIFFPGNMYSPINSVYYEYIEIKAKDKKKILEELKKYFNVDKTTLFPSKENNASKVKQIFIESPTNSEKKEISLEKEVDYFFERIDYELEIYKYIKADKYSKNECSRKIRKERADLGVYLSKIENRIEEKKMIELLRKRIDEKFEVLERSKV